MGTRDVILDAAAHVMHSRGLAYATTKEIARAAGYSEATLYKHFKDKSELLVAVLRERSSGFVPLMKALHDRAGEATVLETLAEVALAAIAWYEHGFPMLASVFSDPKILASHREGLRRQGAGPHKANEAVAAYLGAEQRLSRVRAEADVDAAAGLLLGACFQYAFLSHMSGADVPDRRSADEAGLAFARALVESLLPETKVPKSVRRRSTPPTG